VRVLTDGKGMEGWPEFWPAAALGLTGGGRA
jgi:hypothetical protein